MVASLRPVSALPGPRWRATQVKLTRWPQAVTKTIKERAHFAALTDSEDKRTVLNLSSSTPVSDWGRNQELTAAVTAPLLTLANSCWNAFG